MTTPEFISTEVCGTVLALGGASIGVGCAALRGHWARFSVSFAAVPKGKRWGPVEKDADAAPAVAADPGDGEDVTAAGAGPALLRDRKAS